MLDTLAAADSAVVQSPLPGGVSTLLRWMFNLPARIQIAAVVVLALAALAALAVIWMRRQAIRRWLGTRSRGWKIGLAGVAVLATAGAAGAGLVSWTFMQHDNRFCVSCHVMTPSFQRFQTSEHKTLQCHDCHQQSIFASMRQLYFWVAERPEKIPPHAKVPTRVCADCHIQEQPDSVWKRIVATAGHRVHLNSDSASLKDVQCVTCHGQEVHRFVPVDQTCGQSNCHENVKVRLGKMAGQTSMHCVGCHAFTAPVAENVSVDSTRKSLVPAERECLSCHEMREKLEGFDPLADPHKGLCGSCHDAHEQTETKQAFETCATASCHARADTLTAFHKGIGAAALADCGSCHRAHDWKASGESCVACHRDVLRDSPLGTRHSAGTVLLAERRAPSAEPRFSHREHRDVECTACHTSERRHGELTVTSARDCQSCHHAERGVMRGLTAAARRTGAVRECASCHTRAELAAPHRVTSRVSMTVWKAPKERVQRFEHGKHAETACTSCHTTPVTLAVGADKSCASCHTDHHEPARQCRSCHNQARDVHKRIAHEGCAGSGCHTDQATLALRNTRNVCESCHTNLADHKPGRECAPCHQVRWTPAARAARQP